MKQTPKNLKKSSAKLLDKSLPTDLESGQTVPKLELHGNPDVTTVWVDHFRFILRKDSPIAVLSWFQILPPGSEDQVVHGVETQRIVFPNAIAKALVEIMARNLDHYPVKEKEFGE